MRRREVEFARLLERVREIGARDGEDDHLGLGGLRVNEIGAEVSGVERRAHGADHCSSGVHDRVPRVRFERGAECVVGGDEEEAVESLSDQKAHERDAIRPVVRVPLDFIGEQALPVKSEDAAVSKMTQCGRAP